MATIFLVFAALTLLSAGAAAWIGYRRYRRSDSYAFFYGMAAAFLIVFFEVLAYLWLVSWLLHSLLSY